MTCCSVAVARSRPAPRNQLTASRQGAKAVVFRRRDDRDREMAAMDDRPDPALGDLFDQRRKRGPGIGYALVRSGERIARGSDVSLRMVARSGGIREARSASSEGSLRASG
jgi:hypothetical protein